MEKVSAEEDKKGLTNLLCIFFGILLLGAITALLLTNYKQETLICSKVQDTCYIEKTNLVNYKSKRHFVNFSEIAGINYMRQKVKGNRYAKGYTSYLLTFVLKDNNQVVVFSRDYYDKSEIVKIIKEFNSQVVNSSDKIILNRD